MNDSQKLQKLGVISSLAIYLPAAALLYFSTKFLIPYLSMVTGLETIIFWFVVAGLGVFTPLIITSLIILKNEGNCITKNVIINRLRFHKLKKTDIVASIIGLIAVGIISGLVMKTLEIFIGKFDHSPSFMSFEPLSEGRYWLLILWFPYWLLNILGEELLWHGVMLPRQELVFGKYTWFVHGLGWGLFHVAFGWQLLITILPLIFIQSYIVQKTKNSWTGVIMHAGLNGPSFIAICFGLI